MKRTPSRTQRQTQSLFNDFFVVEVEVKEEEEEEDLTRNSITINCQATTTVASSSSIPALRCDFSWLYNQEDADDKSIISSTISAMSTIETATSFYPVVFTTPGAAATVAAAAAAATPSSTITSSINNPQATLSNSSNSSIPDPSSSSHFSPGLKAGIGVSVSLCSIALAALLVLLYRSHRKQAHASLNAHDARARLSRHDDGFVPLDSRAGEVETKNDDSPGALSPKLRGSALIAKDSWTLPEDEIVADTSGIHELAGRKTPETLVGRGA